MPDTPGKEGAASPIHAYDLEMLPRPAERGTPGNHGWVFGLPPGITPAQWPLDPNTGYSLMHGFTLLLPPDHRVHGPEIVAFSFFATAADQNDGGAPEATGVRDALTGGGARPLDAGLAPFWDAAQTAHPRLFRMTDILDMEYALVLLTQDEFDGPFCIPPQPLPLAQEESASPLWLSMGSAAAFHNLDFEYDSPIVERHVREAFGELPRRELAYHRALSWTPRANDPNAGIAPEDPWTGEATGLYQQSFYFEHDDTGEEQYRERPWAKDHKPNHIGGTMRPNQQTPSFSPHYVEFGEDFGGYNFGAGNAQLDFRDMRFDWACG